MNNDLISRSRMRKKLQTRYDNGEEDFDKGFNLGIAAAIELLDSAPAVEYTFEEAFQKTVCENKLYCPARPQGEWKVYGRQGGIPISDYCTNCKYEMKWYRNKYNYCPNCGAKMKGGAENG